MVPARGIAVVLGACFIAALGPLPAATASRGDGDAQAARSKLTISAAKRAIGRKLLTEYSAKRGSLLAYCNSRSRFLVGCDVLFRDTDGNYWCGHAGVRAYGKRHRKLKVRLNVATLDCQYF